MTAFGKTILGKILGTAAKIVLPIGAGITGIGAIGGIAKGVGVLGGIGTAFNKVGSGVSVVATKAIDLVTGSTADERKAIKTQSDETAAAAEKLRFADKLMKAGASQAEAYATAGIATDSSGTPVVSAGFGSTLLKLGLIGVVLFALAKILKIIK